MIKKINESTEQMEQNEIPFKPADKTFLVTFANDIYPLEDYRRDFEAKINTLKEWRNDGFTLAEDWLKEANKEYDQMTLTIAKAYDKLGDICDFYGEERCMEIVDKYDKYSM